MRVNALSSIFGAGRFTGRLRWEWLLTLLVTLLSALALQSSSWVNQVDAWLYDKLLAQNAKPVNPDIVIIAIDESSILELGHWPWPRRVHAQLLQVLAQARPKAVGFEVQFSEPSDLPGDDIALAEAIKNPALGGVVLPVALSGPFTPGQAPHLSRPLPLLEQEAKGLGHTHMALDADGMARGMHFFEGPLDHPPWPSLALKLAMFGDSVSTGPNISDELVPYPQIPLWQVSPKVLLPYGGTIGHYRTVPFKSVLNGEVPKEVFTGKYVLIGMTATGIGSHYPTPASGSQALMPGVQISATALDGLISHNLVTSVNPLQMLMLTLLALSAWLVSLWHQSPKSSTPVLIMMLIVVIVVCALFLWYANIWLPPGNLATCAALAYVIWTWRRLVVLVNELNVQITHLEPTAARHPSRWGLVEGPASNDAKVSGNAIALFGERLSHTPLERNEEKPRRDWQEILKALDAGIVAAEMNRALLADTLHALPEAVLLTDPKGLILLVNTRAKEFLGDALVTGHNAASLFQMGESGSSHKVSSFGCVVATNWRELMAQAQMPSGVEIGLKRKVLEQDTVVQVRATAVNSLKYLQRREALASHQGQNEREGWLVVLSDITEQKSLQQQRDHALQLLSHDIRAPQSALLILMRNLASTGTLSVLQNEALERMRLQIGATLRLADDFVWLLRSQTVEYIFEEIDLVSLLHQVFDRAWPLAQAKSIRLLLTLAAFEGKNLWIQAEARLLERAFFNLVENAIKFSEPQTEIEISLAWCQLATPEGLNSPKQIRIDVRDQGKGMTPHDLKHLFVRNRRVAPTSAHSSNPTGHGLGLALVQRVVGQHRGRLEVFSDLGLGSRFVVTLPVVE